MTPQEYIDSLAASTPSPTTHPPLTSNSGGPLASSSPAIAGDEPHQGLVTGVSVGGGLILTGVFLGGVWAWKPYIKPFFASQAAALKGLGTGLADKAAALRDLGRRRQDPHPEMGP